VTATAVGSTGAATTANVATVEPTGPPRMDGRALVLAEVALCAVTVTLAVTMARLFDTSGFLPKLIAVAVAGHLAAVLVRRSRLRLWLAVPLLVALGLLVIAWLYLPGSTTFGIPTGHTLDVARSRFLDLSNLSGLQEGVERTAHHFLDGITKDFGHPAV